MTIHLYMGNEAIGMGAVHAGVRFVAGYPGTPSTEVLETVAKANDGSIHVEWSTNEKAALEAAIGASWSGARALVTMKQVGLNVASDPLMTLSYIGVKAGLVLVVADDPGPISSQTEQDTRSFGKFSKVPVLDPSSSGECYGMIQDAFEISEKYSTPVILRPTTRICHACGTVKTRGGIADCAPAEAFKHADVDENDPSWDEGRTKPEGFVRDTLRWVVFPRTSYENHGKVERRATQMAEDFAESYHPNRIEMSGKRRAYNDPSWQNLGKASDAASFGVACGGISYHYVREALERLGADVPIMKVSTPYPFPVKMAQSFLNMCDEILVVEELDPVIERELVSLCGQDYLKRTIHGKLDGTLPYAGEQSVENVTKVLAGLLGIPAEQAAFTSAGDLATAPKPAIPARPPVLCAGCPHRASFYAVKKAVGKRPAVFCGDIGCYTLGNAAPLDMVDTCVCMGADITIAQGIKTVDPEKIVFSFIGDSTFFASGITGVINAVYNRHDIIICVLDNSTTAMTGMQPHPGTGHTMMGVDGSAVSIPAIFDALGVDNVTVNPLDAEAAQAAVRDAIEKTGVRAIIFKSPCVNISKPLHPPVVINQETCIGCHKCIDQIGCPGIIIRDGRVEIDETLCFGCQLCRSICPTGAIEKGEE